MLKFIMNTKVNYEYIDNDKSECIVFLHGWGQNIEMMKFLGNNFINNYNILYIDLPGFGKSSDPNFSWTVYDYAISINSIIDSLGLKNIDIVGHSFGGRIGLIYASLYKVEKLICLASPFCKELNKLPIKNRIYKFFKNVPYLTWISNIMKKNIGSIDYKNSTEVMKGVLVKSINVDMIDNIKTIKCPTLLLWGALDTAVPINRAYELNDLIKNSKLIIYENATHYAYLEKINEVTKDISDFLK